MQVATAPSAAVLPHPPRFSSTLLRVGFAVVIILHGLAHSLPVFLVTGAPAATDGWVGEIARLITGMAATLATFGFIAGGLGMLGLEPFSRMWNRLMLWAVGGSIILAVLSPEPFWLAGLGLNALALAVVAFAPWSAGESRWRNAPRVQSRLRSVRRAFAALGRMAAWGFLLWILCFSLLRPWVVRWGANAGEVSQPLPGDPEPRLMAAEINHATAVRAPPQTVWPWLVQIGQDRGGFYSYEWLEDLFGLNITNADRIHPEWQNLAAGDFVRSTPADWMGGRFGDHIGWRVLEAQPNRHLVLEYWGAFVLLPANDGTRLLIRTRTGRPAVWNAPLLVLAFEPVHFIMQRAMLRGIRERAERA